MDNLATCAHDWTPADDHWACTTCGDTTEACSECERPLSTSLLVCHGCLTRFQKIPTDIADWMRAYNYGVQLIHIRAIRYDRDRITTSDDDARLPFGLDQVTTDPEDTRIAAVKHPDQAVDYLINWADAWAETLNETRPEDALQYLTDRTLWAVQNPDTSGWDAYLDEARQVRATIRRLLGIAPVTEPVPCVHCAGRVVRDWTEDGLDDLRRCTRCRMEWPTEARLLHTNALVLQQLPTTHPDTLITTDQARRIYPNLNPATIRSWIHRGHLTEHGRDVRGTPLYRLGDFTDRAA